MRRSSWIKSLKVEMWSLRTEETGTDCNPGTESVVVADGACSRREQARTNSGELRGGSD